MDQETNVFYFYSIYSNSLDNAYYLVNKMLFFFRKPEIKNYIFAGITYQKLKVERFREMGIEVIWEQAHNDFPEHKATFVSGNFDKFLTG